MEFGLKLKQVAECVWTVARSCQLFHLCWAKSNIVNTWFCLPGNFDNLSKVVDISIYDLKTQKKWENDDFISSESWSLLETLFAERKEAEAIVSKLFIRFQLGEEKNILFVLLHNCLCNNNNIIIVFWYSVQSQIYHDHHLLFLMLFY